MKICACYIVLNEEDYIFYSLKSVYDFVDQIVIIHGSTKYASPELVNEQGLSVDGTKEQIEGFMKLNNCRKIVDYVEVGAVEDKRDLRNAYLDRVRTEMDWILVVDGDELYSIEDFHYMKSILLPQEDLVHVFFDQYWYWGDFNHIAIVDEDKVYQEHKDKYQWFTDRAGTRARQGQYHERLFRNRKGFRYTSSHSVVTDATGHDVYISKKYEDKRLITPHIHRYHYGYIKPRANLEERVKYYHKRDGATDIGHDMYLHYIDTGEIKHPLYSVQEFEGVHPPSIWNHPYFEKHVRDL